MESDEPAAGETSRPESPRRKRRSSAVVLNKLFESLDQVQESLARMESAHEERFQTIEAKLGIALKLLRAGQVPITRLDRQ